MCAGGSRNCRKRSGRASSSNIDLARFFETAAKSAKKPKNIANWILNDLQNALSTAGKTINDCPLPPEPLNDLLNLSDSGRLSRKQGTEVSAAMCATGRGPAAIVKEKRIERLSHTGPIDKFVDEV